MPTARYLAGGGAAPLMYLMPALHNSHSSLRPNIIETERLSCCASDHGKGSLAKNPDYTHHGLALGI